MISVRSAGIKGLGVFANSIIPRGTRIFAERPSFGIRPHQGPKDVYPAFRALPQNEQTEVTSLSAQATTELALLRWFHVLWYSTLTSTLPRISTLKAHRLLLDVFRSNAFSLNEESRYSQAIFPKIARLNHECVPNAQANFNDRADAMHVHAIRDINPEEEVTLSYLDDTGEMTIDERRARLVSYGFSCACPICAGNGPRATNSMGRRDAMRAIISSLHEPAVGASPTSSKASELQALCKIIGLMQAEGLVGRELAARYAVAAEWFHELGDVQKAIEYADEGLRIDAYTLGTDHDTYLSNKAKVEQYEALLQDSLGDSEEQHQTLERVAHG